MSVYKIPTPKPNLSRNGFDLSSRRVFSTSAGELLPVGVWEVNPSEHFRISVQDLVRTQPLNTAAFARCKEYYHFFFVPYSALWRYSDEFFTGVKNMDSSVRRGLAKKDEKGGNLGYDWVPSHCPVFDFDSVHSYLHSISSVNQKFDALGYPFHLGAFKLLNLLGYGVTSRGNIVDIQSSSENFDHRSDDVFGNGSHSSPFAYSNNTVLTGVKFNPFRLLAYQRIYNDFYRNQQWEKPDVESFNVDFCADDSLLEIPLEVAAKSLTMRYRQWNKDNVTSAIPTPNYSDGIFNVPFYYGEGDGYGSVSVSHSSSSGGSVFFNTASADGFSPNDLRAVFALDKMLEATRRANGLDYSSQIAAHFGFNVPDSRKPMARYIGGFDNSISIGEVIATAAGSAGNSPSAKSVVGQVTGKGIGSLNSRPVDFDVKEHGIIMCIHSVVPQPDYNSFFVDSFNRKVNREDYFQPEFQNLGYVPLQGSDLVFMNHSSSSSDSQSVNNSIVGYLPRYVEYKSARDVVFGEFQSGMSLSAWTSPRWDFLNFIYKSDSSSRVELTASNFMVDPSILDNIFAVNYDGSSSTDQFLVNSYFDVKAVRPMSITGLSPI